MNTPTNKIRKGDTVLITTGSEKGKSGKVVSYNKDTNRVVVEGIKTVKRHVKPNMMNRVGSIQQRDADFHASNVSLMDGKKRSRVGFEMKKDKKVRVLRQSKNKEVA